MSRFTYYAWPMETYYDHFRFSSDGGERLVNGIWTPCKARTLRELTAIRKEFYKDKPDLQKIHEKVSIYVTRKISHVHIVTPHEKWLQHEKEKNERFRAKVVKSVKEKQKKKDTLRETQKREKILYGKVRTR